ncbi:MAG: ArsR family transcriptional regulator [bacterium]
MNDYHPTLWRTCRVLANPQRLACLKEVLLHPDTTVEEIAAATALPHNKASLGLRALQARGLIRVRRHSRWAHYLPHPDPLVPCAAPILAAMKRVLIAAPVQKGAIIATLTAFTHPRRLSILKRLSLHPLPLTEDTLAVTTHISPPALLRHLKNLQARALAARSDAGWRLQPKPSRLAQTFLTLIATEKP